VANGSEEMEVLVTADVLRRAKADVVVASAEEVVVARHGTRIVADALLQDAAGQQFDLIVVPASGRQLLCSSPPRYTFPLTPHGADCLSRVACRA
jgi:putative intracellular protease/amidase